MPNESTLSINATYTPSQAERGPGATPTASTVGFVRFKPDDIYWADTLVWSDQSMVVSASDKVVNKVGVITGSTSSYHYFAQTFLRNQGIVRIFTSVTSNFLSYLNYFRSSTAIHDITNDPSGLGQVGIIAIKKIKYGESIKPLSFTGTTSAGVTFTDSASASVDMGIVNDSNGLSAGLIFYNEGIVLINGSSLSAVQSISALTSVDISSTYKIWQMNAFCSVSPDQLNYPSNDSAFYTRAVTSDPNDLHDPALTAYTYGYQWGATGTALSSSKGTYYLTNQFYNNSPYVTSVGLYDDENNLLAVAKLAQPIKKSSYLPMTFRVSFDFD